MSLCLRYFLDVDTVVRIIQDERNVVFDDIIKKSPCPLYKLVRQGLKLHTC